MQQSQKKTREKQLGMNKERVRTQIKEKWENNTGRSSQFKTFSPGSGKKEIKMNQRVT